MLPWLHILLAVLLTLAGQPERRQRAHEKAEAAGRLAVRSLELERWSDAAESPRRARLVDWTGAPAPGEISWGFVRIAGMQENRDALEARDGWWDLPMPEGLGGDALRRSGLSGAVGVVGVDLVRRVVEVDAAALRAFILERGMVAGGMGQLPLEGQVRVRRVESAKAIFGAGTVPGAAGDSPAPVSEACSKTGQAVEIRPLMDPAMTPVGADIAVRAYAGGTAAANSRVRAVHVASGEVQEVACADTGIGHFTLSKAGVWRLELHLLRQEGDGDGVREWVLYSGVLAFAAAEGEAAK